MRVESRVCSATGAYQSGFARLAQETRAAQKRNGKQHRRDGRPAIPSPQRAIKLPDFIDVVLNAGDQRSPNGATIGQSLHNWGPVAEAGGRTVAMTNIGTDTDSQAQLATQMSSVFCKA